MTVNQDTKKTETVQPTATKHTNQAKLATALSNSHSQIQCPPALLEKARRMRAAQLGQLNPIGETFGGISSAVAEIHKSFEKLGSTIVDTSGIEALKSTLYPAVLRNQRELQKIKGACLGAELGAVNQVPKWLCSAVVKPSVLDKFSDTIAHISGNSKRIQDQMASVFDIPKLDGFKTSMAGVIGDIERLHTTMGKQPSAFVKQWEKLFAPPLRINIPDICSTGLGSAMARVKAMQSQIAQIKPLVDFSSNWGDFVGIRDFGIEKIRRQFAEAAKKFGMPPSMEDTSQKAHERGEINGAFFDAVMSEAGLAAEGESAAWHLIELLWSRIQSIINGFTGWDSSREDYAQEARMKILSIAKRFREEISYINLVKAVTEYGQEELTNYLLRAVKNELIDVSRAARRKKHLILTESIRFESIKEYEKEITVSDAGTIEDIPILDKISDEERLSSFAKRCPQHYQAAVLVEYEGHTQHEAAEIMEITQPRVSVLLSEAPKKAKKIFEGLYSGDRNSLYIVGE